MRRLGGRLRRRLWRCLCWRRRVRRLYERLYRRLGQQYRHTLALLDAQDMRAHAQAAGRYSRTVARLCRLQILTGVAWDAECVFRPWTL